MAFPGASDALLMDPGAVKELDGSFVDVREAKHEDEKAESDAAANTPSGKPTKRKRVDGKKEGGEQAAEAQMSAKQSAEMAEDAMKHAKKGVEVLLQGMLKSTRADGRERLEGKELQGLQLKSVEYGRVSCTLRVCESMLDAEEEFHRGGVSTLVGASEKLALTTVYSPCPAVVEQSINLLDSIPLGSRLHVVSMVVCSGRTALVTSEIRNAETSRLLVSGRSVCVIADRPQSTGRGLIPSQNVARAGRANLKPTFAPTYKLVAPVTVQIPNYRPASVTNAVPAPPQPSSGANINAHVAESEHLPPVPVGVRRMSCCGHPRRHHPKHYCPNPGMRYPGYPKEKVSKRRAV